MLVLLVAASRGRFSNGVGGDLCSRERIPHACDDLFIARGLNHAQQLVFCVQDLVVLAPAAPASRRLDGARCSSSEASPSTTTSSNAISSSSSSRCQGVSSAADA